MLLVGVALAIPSLPAAIAVLMFWTSTNAQIRSEEQVLATALGPRYLTYRAEVPRWIGRMKAIEKR